MNAMNWSNKSLSFLGLEPAQMKILNALNQGKTHMDVAKETAIPRTTVAFIIKRLINKGLVIPVHFGKRFKYVALTEAQLSQKLEQTLGEMRSTARERKGVQIRLSKENQFTIHIGYTEMVDAYTRIAANNKNTRIKAIQSNKSWNTIVEKLPAQELIQFNKAVIENDLIIDGILQDDYYEMYKQYLKNHPQDIAKSTAKSLTGRMADYTLIPKEFFDFYSEIWIFETTVVIINWKEEIAVEITNEQMMRFLRDMFEFVKMGGRKVNHEAAMMEVLKTLN